MRSAYSKRWQHVVLQAVMLRLCQAVGVGVAVAVVVAARSSSLVERRFVVSRPSGLLKVAMGPPLLLRGLRS